MRSQTQTYAKQLMMHNLYADDGSVLFFTVERQQRLDLISHLIPNSKQPVLLRGPEQSGKSFFLKAFVQQNATDYVIFPLNLSLAENEADIYGELKQIFDAGDKADKYPQSRLKAWSNVGKTVLLLVEDVHALNKAILSGLFEINNEYGCVRLILSSSENLGEAVEQQCQLIDLEPFSQKQTADYARSKIELKGMAFEGLAGVDDVVLFIETGGLPGRINDVLEQMLLNPHVDNEQKFMTKKMTILFTIGIMLISISVISSFWSEDVTPVEIKSEIAISKPKQPEVQKSKKIEQVIAAAPRAKAKDLVLAREVATQRDKKEEKKALVSTKEIETIPVVKQQIVQQPKKEQIVKKKIKPELLRVNEVKKAKPVVIIKKDVVVKTTSRLEKDTSWIKERVAGRYTLQLLGLSNNEAAKQYLANKTAIQELHYYQSKANKGRWYTIIYGDFLDRAAAEKAAKSLPKIIGKNKPWIRKFSDIQKSMFQ